MKKLLAILLTIISVVGIACAFGGCGNEDEQTGVFYTVTEAYERGYLTREQVMSIAYYHNGGTEHNEEIMGDDYKPFPPTKPNAETEKAIKKTYYHSDNWKRYENDFKFEDINCGYYGVFDNVIAVVITVYGEAVALPAWEEKVDDITIYYTDIKRILIWEKQ